MSGLRPIRSVAAPTLPAIGHCRTSFNQLLPMTNRLWMIRAFRFRLQLPEVVMGMPWYFISLANSQQPTSTASPVPASIRQGGLAKFSARVLRIPSPTFALAVIFQWTATGVKKSLKYFCRRCT